MKLARTPNSSRATPAEGASEVPPSSSSIEHQHAVGSWWRFPPLLSALICGGIAGTGFLLSHLGFLPEHAERLFYWLAIPIGAWHWTREAVEELVHDREVGIGILMLTATVGSAVLGLWDEAAALVFLYGAAEGTEEYTFARTRTAIRGLLDLAPREAHLLRDGEETVIPARDLSPGDVFLVRPGEAIPTDGVIHSGTSSVDESAVTGESIPVDRGPGMKVLAATINRQGALTVEATTAFADNTLSKIIHLVEEAQEQKGRAQQWIEQFGRWYSPCVLLAALLLLVTPWVAGVAADSWHRRAVLLLVAAAPCALIMSMPVAMAAGIGWAGRHGILIKGGMHLEHLGVTRVVAFDKTGTLTHGQPAVADVIALAGTEADLLAAAAAIERFSEHPLAQAVLRRARAAGIEPADATGFEALTGAGARAVVRGEPWLIGNVELFRQLGADVSRVQSMVDALHAQGRTVVLVGRPGEPRGILAFQDTVRANAHDVIRALHVLGMRTVMLTGDSTHAAQAVARALDIDDARGGLKPDDKVTAVRDLERQHGAVLMVGDGVNDAPALAAATCGVAMGAAGSDAAIEAADIALMADDLAKVEVACRLGRKARRIGAENIVFSLLVLAAMVPLAVTGTISIAATVLIHEGSELLAVANGLRVVRLPASHAPSARH